MTSKIKLPEKRMTVDKDGVLHIKGLQGDKGDKGDRGDRGDNGRDGKDGKDGLHGRDGKNGIDGKSIKGDPGKNGSDGAKGDKGDKGDRGNGGPMGPQGWSAYQMALMTGFVGSPTDWLESMGLSTTQRQHMDDSYTHAETIGNPHQTTKDDIGLGNIDNTSDLDKPVSQAQKIAIGSIQGFLTNGKVVASVTSNNLLQKFVLDNLTDASPTDPIYIKIGDTLRIITGPLSISSPAGTDYLSLGSTRAAMSMRLFVYAVWNTNTLDVSMVTTRSPYARWYGDLVTNNTDPTGRLMSGVTAPKATDVMELVGSFDVRLSAGASYQWSLPTNPYILMRPSYHTDECLQSTVLVATDTRGLSTTLANIGGNNGLVLDVAGGKWYDFEAVLFTTSNVLGGVKFAPNGSCTVSSIIYDCFIYSGAVIVSQTRSTSFAGVVGNVALNIAGTAVIKGTMKTANPGSFGIQFAQSLSSALSSSILAGSTLRIKEIS